MPAKQAECHSPLVTWHHGHVNCFATGRPVTIPVIDVFAGPGGLNEGFSAHRSDDGTPLFKTVASFEMDQAACLTLTLRATFRQLKSADSLATYRAILRGETGIPRSADTRALADHYGLDFAQAWVNGSAEVHQVELGSEHDNSSQVIRQALQGAATSKRRGRWVLIGGPPCQAYSLAGRSRRANDEHFEEDKKHFLYREYLKILAKFQPAVFVMENVKGLLSSTHAGEGMFEQIRLDLANPGGGAKYAVHSLTVDTPPNDLQPEDFIIRSEDYGVPQKRHRVILVGLRQPDFDLAGFPRLQRQSGATVRQVIGGLPKIRSRVSRIPDSPEVWSSVRNRAIALTSELTGELGDMTHAGTKDVPRLGSPWQSGRAEAKGDRRLVTWLKGQIFDGISQHEARRHMPDDLVRYFFAASFAATQQRSPNLTDFEEAELLPNHASAHSERRPFSDRFRVQRWEQPSTTIVSHIAKDGHYYIHPDPMQMRSLTVREAARLQTFPDDYFFAGNRTQQYVQVGNAVPPLLANQIAEIVSWIFEEQKSKLT